MWCSVFYSSLKSYSLSLSYPPLFTYYGVFCVFFVYCLFGSVVLGTQVFDNNFESYFLVHISMCFFIISPFFFGKEGRVYFVVLCLENKYYRYSWSPLYTLHCPLSLEVTTLLNLVFIISVKVSKWLLHMHVCICKQCAIVYFFQLYINGILLYLLSNFFV